MVRGNRNVKTGKNKELEIKEGDNEGPVDSMRDIQNDTCILEVVQENKAMLTDLKSVIAQIQETQSKITDKLDSLDHRVINLDLRLTQQGKSIDMLHCDLNDLKGQQKSIEGTVQVTQNRITALETLEQRTKERLNRIERKSRENNLRIVGYQESPNENVEQIVSSVLNTKFGMKLVAIQSAHRTGKNIMYQGKKQPKHIIFKLLNHPDKIHIMQNKAKCLEHENYFITDDMTEDDLELKRRLKPVTTDAESKGQKWKFRNGKLIIGGQLYTGPIPNKDTKTQRPRTNIQINQNFNLPPPLGKEQKRRKDIQDTVIQDNSSWNNRNGGGSPVLGAVGGTIPKKLPTH